MSEETSMLKNASYHQNYRKIWPFYVKSPLFGKTNKLFMKSFVSKPEKLECSVFSLRKRITILNSSVGVTILINT